MTGLSLAVWGLLAAPLLPRSLQLLLSSCPCTLSVWGILLSLWCLRRRPARPLGLEQFRVIFFPSLYHLFLTIFQALVLGPFVSGGLGRLVCGNSSPKWFGR